MRAESIIAELERYTPLRRAATAVTVEEARAYCRRLARTHYENFTVASWLLPRSLRQHFCNVYAYCRWADDLADETAGGAESLALLDRWADELSACYQGAPRHPVMVALAETIDEFGIPIEPFRQLLMAFRQDQSVHRYETLDDLLEYCRSSADPVGRLVLYLGRCQDDARGTLSDQVCTGLQLANFCQDIRRDWERGRLYVPRSIYQDCGGSEKSLDAGPFDRGWKRAVARLADEAESRLTAGRALVPLVSPELQLDVWLFVEGGLAILRKIRQADYDVWSRRPTVSKHEQFALLLRGGWRKWRRRLGPGLVTATGVQG